MNVNRYCPDAAVSPSSVQPFVEKAVSPVCTLSFDHKMLGSTPAACEPLLSQKLNKKKQKNKKRSTYTLKVI